MAKKKANGEKVFQDMLALLGNPNPAIFIRACTIFLESEVWLLHQDAQHLKQLEDRLRERMKRATDVEEIHAFLALDRVVKVRTPPDLLWRR